MKEIKKQLVTVSLSYCPVCRDVKGVADRPCITTADDKGKFCEKCGTSYDVQRYVDVCPICRECIIEWHGHFAHSCNSRGLVKVTILDLSMWSQECSEFVLDRDGDLWEIPFFMDDDLHSSSPPKPVTMEDLRTALNKKTGELRKEIDRMWTNAAKLGLNPAQFRG